MVRQSAAAIQQVTTCPPHRRVVPTPPPTKGAQGWLACSARLIGALPVAKSKPSVDGCPCREGGACNAREKYRSGYVGVHGIRCQRMYFVSVRVAHLNSRR